MQSEIFAGGCAPLKIGWINMPSGVVLSNGRLSVRLDDMGLVDGVFFPHVGYESHSENAKHRVGIYVDGEISWLDDGNWRIVTKLSVDALISSTIAVHDRLGISLEFEDFVRVEENIFARNIHIINNHALAREVKLFMHQAFKISSDLREDDTAQHLKEHGVIIHHKGHRCFVVGGQSVNGDMFDQFSVGKFGKPGLDGTWRDAEDGELSGSDFETGTADSTIRFSLDLPPYSSTRVHYQLVSAKSPHSGLALYKKSSKNGMNFYRERALRSWRKWLSPGVKLIDKIDPALRRKLVNSLMSIKTHVDANGAIVSSVSGHGPQSLVQIHDGAYAIWPLVRLGFTKEPLGFFEFCRQVVNQDGWLLSKYRVDKAAYPGQNLELDSKGDHIEDVGIVVFVFYQYYLLHPKSKKVKDFYENMIISMADFIYRQIDPTTKLPYSQKTYASSIAYAALLSASNIAEKMNDQRNTVKWRAVANDIREAADIFFDEGGGYLKKSASDDGISVDAFFGAFMFGLVELDDIRVDIAGEALDVLRTDDGLYRRFEGDGEADLVSSLWMAQYFLEVGENDKAERIINMVSREISRTGLTYRKADKSEVDSVWASAEYVNTLLDMITK